MAAEAGAMISRASQRGRKHYCSLEIRRWRALQNAGVGRVWLQQSQCHPISLRLSLPCAVRLKKNRGREKDWGSAILNCAVCLNIRSSPDRRLRQQLTPRERGVRLVLYFQPRRFSCLIRRSFTLTSRSFVRSVLQTALFLTKYVWTKKRHR